MIQNCHISYLPAAAFFANTEATGSFTTTLHTSSLSCFFSCWPPNDQKCRTPANTPCETGIKCGTCCAAERSDKTRLSLCFRDFFNLFNGASYFCSEFVGNMKTHQPDDSPVFFHRVNMRKVSKQSGRSILWNSFGVATVISRALTLCPILICTCSKTVLNQCGRMPQIK